MFNYLGYFHIGVVINAQFLAHFLWHHQPPLPGVWTINSSQHNSYVRT